MRFITQPVFRLFQAIACFVFLLLGRQAAAQAPQDPLVLTSSQQDQLRSLAKRILDHSSSAGCKKNSCTVLVTNFTLPMGQTSRLGIHLADQVSKELASQQSAVKIIDRSRLQSFLEENRISSTLFDNEKAICWLTKQLGATTVLRGTTEARGGPLRAQASLLNCSKDRTGPVEEFSFPTSDSVPDLTPIEPFPKTLSSTNSPSIPLVRRVGEDGVSAPSCVYCPIPSYTDPAREAKFNGTVLLQVTVSPEGRTLDAKVFRGAPYGLNESAMKDVSNWRFKPAKHQGQPVACMVMIEATYHLN